MVVLLLMMIVMPTTTAMRMIIKKTVIRKMWQFSHIQRSPLSHRTTTVIRLLKAGPSVLLGRIYSSPSR
jgi:hypothetical protein